MNRLRLLSLASLVLLPACSSSSDETADLAAPEIKLQVTPYTAIDSSFVFQSQWSDDKAVVRVGLFIDGQRLTDLDLTKRTIPSAAILPESAHSLFLEAEDTAGHKTKSESVKAVFAGPGQFLSFFDGWTTTTIKGWAGLDVDVASDAVSIEDQKAHVTMPAGMKRVIGYLYWKADVDWNIELAIGTGGCPDDGQKLAALAVNAKEGFVEVPFSGSGDLPTGQWFSHLKFIDGDKHAGQKIHFSTLMLALPK